MMKRLFYLLIWASFVVISGCNPKEQEPVKEDSVTLTSLQDIIDYKAQSLTITVTSSETWTLSPFDYEWVTASTTNGESGDPITFDIDKNTTGQRRKAAFIFGAGKAKDIYSIVQEPGEDEPEPEPEPEPEVPVDPTKLSGTVIGSKYSVDYANGNSQSTTVNTKDNVFDGDYATFFASYDRSRTWVGLDLGEKHVITKVGWSPRIDHQSRVE